MIAAGEPAEIRSEVCVLGGGPAGAVIARRLAELGHTTTLVERGRARRQPCAESLAPSITPILDSLGLRDLTEVAAFRHERRGLVLWEPGAAPEKDFDAGPALLIERTQFDRLLREAAASNGARLMDAATAFDPQRLPSGGWQIPVKTTGGLRTVYARFLVDARGRQRRGKLHHAGPRTAALWAAWEIGDRDFTQTRIEAGIDSWFWGTPLPDRIYSATVFVDSERIGGSGGDGRTRLYRDLLAHTHLLGELSECRMIAPVQACDATSGMSGDLIGHDFIRVGEAAVAIDPLASQGVQRAMLSAIQGAAAVHTLLTTGHEDAPALQFYRERQQAAATKARRHAASLYALRAGGAASSFWTRRALPMQDTAIEIERVSRPGGRLPQQLCPAPGLRLVEVPVLAGALVRRAWAVSHPTLEEPVAYLGGVALAPLIADMCTASATEKIIERWSHQITSATARDIADWMYRNGLVVDGSALPGDSFSARREPLGIGAL
jgi:flavin-dependent dehydrogenase